LWLRHLILQAGIKNQILTSLGDPEFLNVRQIYALVRLQVKLSSSTPSTNRTVRTLYSNLYEVNAAITNTSAGLMNPQDLFILVHAGMYLASLVIYAGLATNDVDALLTCYTPHSLSRFTRPSVYSHG
jgi:hypothetical protein